MKKVKVGVISFEHMHAASYTNALVGIEEAELVGIADSNTFRGTEMASHFCTRYYEDYRELLKTDIDGVIVCTCNKLHSAVVVDAAAAGKHILVEKPFAISCEDSRIMLDACKNYNVIIMTAFSLRFNQAVINAKKAIDNGEIGDILCITGINHGKLPSGWFLDKNLSGGGAVMDHTVHIADLMRWFTKSEAVSVYAESGELIHNKGIDDCGILNVEFNNNVFATIDTSWAHHSNYTIWPEVYMEIVGTKGVILVDAFKQNERVYADNTVYDDVWGSSGDAGLVREFVEVLSTGRAPLVTGYDGAKATDIALAAYRSSISHNVEKVTGIE
jgi:Predicted dehydrogenases and related proteins